MCCASLRIAGVTNEPSAIPVGSCGGQTLQAWQENWTFLWQRGPTVAGLLVPEENTAANYR